MAQALDLIFRGVVDCVTREDLERKLARSKPLRVKLGIDPTRKDIHLGFAVVLRKLRAFQDLGHKAVLIIGDYTAQIGDPSGKSETRPMLAEDEVRANAASYLEQMGKILDTRDPARFETRWNGEWFSRLGFLEVVRLAARLTVARMIERDDFSKRLKAGVPVGLHELLYPMMQGYDSVAIEADVELGGTDQLFNLLVGRQLQPQFGQESQICLTTPLLVGLDGQRKMSKSYDNYVGIADPPEQQYGKTMSIPDAILKDWFVLCTAVPLAEVDALLGGHPMEAKRRLAREIVTIYHGEEAAARAEEHFRKTVQERQAPDEMPTFAVPADLGLAALVAAAFSVSRSEARRLIEQGAVSIDGNVLSDASAPVPVKGGEVLKAGKRRYVRLAR